MIDMEKGSEREYEKMREYIFMKGKESKILDKLEEKRSIEFMDYFDENNNTALHYAVSQNYSKVIQLYFEYAKDKNLWKNDKSSVSQEAIRFSIKVWVNFENSDGMTALHYASLKGLISVAELLENEGAKADKITKTGLTMLHIAVQENRLESFIHFRGKVDLNATDNNQSTVLHWAVYKGCERIVEYILSENKFQVSYKDINGQTGLHLAVLYNKSKIIEILLKNGANRMIKDKENKLAVELTEEKEIIDMMGEREKGCTRKEYVYKPEEKDRYYLLKILLMMGMLLLVSFLNFKFFNGKGMDFDGKDIVKIVFLVVENVLLVFGVFLLLFVCYKKSNIPKMEISQLKNFPEIIEFYCFNCRVGPQENEQKFYKKNLYQHCDICNECFMDPFKHSLLCNRCICRNNVLIYAVSIQAFIIFCIFQVIHALQLGEDLINGGENSNNYRALKIILMIADLLMFVVLVFCVRELYRVIIFVSRKKKDNILLTESSLNLDSTLLAEKLGDKMVLRRQSVVSNKENSNNLL